MATITTRAGKGSPLTNTEVDNNFTNINTELGQKESASNKGVANGYASLDGSGKVPSTQLPSYVDDVVEGANLAALPATGETGKIYVTLDTNKTYRWSGSAYVEISASPGSTDAVTEGSTNLYFTNARARSAISATGSLSYNSTTGVLSYTAPTAVSQLTNDSGYITSSALSPYLTSATAASTYQTALVSGTSIKTVNGQSVLGSGNIQIDGGVTSFNTRTGAVTLSSGDVTTALGYTPATVHRGSATVSSAGYTCAFTVTGSGLASAIRFTVQGTAGSVVVNSLVDLVVNHHQDIVISSLSGIYTVLTVRVVSDSNDSFAVLLTTNSANAANLAIDVFPLNNETITFTSSNPYSGSTLTHQCNPGFATSATGGISGDINAAGAIYASGGNIVLHAGNYSSYALPLSGGTLTGGLTGTSAAFTSVTDNSYRVMSAIAMDVPRNIGASTNLDTDLESGGAYSSYGAGGTSWNAPFSYGGVIGLAFGSGIRAQLGFDIRHNNNDYGDLWYRTKNNLGYATWRKVLHSANYNSYSPTLTGGGASGTWAINITGNAATATSATDSTKLPLSGGTLTGTLSLSNANIAQFYTGNGSLRGYINATDTDDNHFQIATSGGEDIVFKDGGLSGTRNLVIRGNNTGTEAYGSMRSPIFYDNNDTSFYLDPASTTTSLQIAGAIEQGNNFAHPNVEWSASSSSSGMVIFKLPGGSGNYGMVHMVFDIYEYNSPRIATVIVGGHNWNGSWYSTACNVIGYTDKQIRLGFKDGQYCVVFGTSGSGWSYGTIRLRKIHNGSFYNNVMDLGGSYSVSQTTTESFTSVSGDLRGLRTPSTMEVDGILYGYNSIRSNIFYDNDNTGYYLDPASTSNVNSIQIAGVINQSGPGRTATISTSNYDAKIGSSDLYIYTKSIEGGSYPCVMQVFRVWDGATSWPLNLQPVGSGVNIGSYGDLGYKLGVYGSMASNDQIRAPIFYDYNDTGYYFDGASTTRANQIHANYIGVNQGINTSWPLIVNGNAYLNGGGYGQAEGSWRAPVFYDSNDTTYYLDPNSSTSGRLRGNLIFNDFGAGVVGTYSSTRYQAVFAMGDAYKLPIDGTTTGSLYGIAWSHPNAGGVAANLNTHGAILMENGGYLCALSGSIRSRDDMRSPIFYDSNNTGYYCDPTSSSRLSTIYCGDVYNDLGGWFRNYGATGLYNQSYGNHFYSDSANYWNVGIGGQTSGGIRFRDSHAGTVRGYVYVDNGNNIGFLNSGGSWRARVVADDYFLVDGSSARAQIFYDSNDTTYYVNPNDYSVLYGLSTYYIRNNYGVATDHQFGVYFDSGLSGAYGIYRESGAWNYPYPDLRIAFHTGIKLGANQSYNGIRFYNDYNMAGQVMSVNNGSDPLGADNVYVNNSLQAGSSLRAPIFYDSNDTGYYLDPTSSQSLRTVGDWRSDAAGWTGEFSGKIQYHSSNWYFQYSGNAIFRNSGGSNVMVCDASGNVTFNGNVTAYSDRRLKDNVRDLTGAMAYLDKISAKRFTWKGDGHDDIGFIAQDVEAAGLSEFVLESQDYDPNTGVTSDPVKTLDYGRMVSVLWQAVKEQELQISAMLVEINSLKEKLQ